MNWHDDSIFRYGWTEKQCQAVATVVDQSYPASRFEVVWDGKDASGSTVSSGVYFATIIAGSETKTKKVVVVK